MAKSGRRVPVAQCGIQYFVLTMGCIIRTIERLDQGHLYPNLEVPGLTCPAWEASTLEKSHLDSLSAGYSEPLLGRHLLTTFGPLQYLYILIL